MATDLNLHRKTTTTDHDTPEGLARDKEVHNRERTWLVCYMLDRSYSLQMGKPFSIKEEYGSSIATCLPISRSPVYLSSIIRNATSWWQKPTAAFGDAGLAAYVVSVSARVLYLVRRVISPCRNYNALCLVVWIYYIQEQHRLLEYRRILTITW